MGPDFHQPAHLLHAPHVYFFSLQSAAPLQYPHFLQWRHLPSSSSLRPLSWALLWLSWGAFPLQRAIWSSGWVIDYCIGYDSVKLMDNSGIFISIWMFHIFFVLVLLLAQYICRCMCCKRSSTRLLRCIIWGPILRTFIGTFLELGFCAYINIIFVRGSKFRFLLNLLLISFLLFSQSLSSSLSSYFPLLFSVSWVPLPLRLMTQSTNRNLEKSTKTLTIPITTWLDSTTQSSCFTATSSLP